MPRPSKRVPPDTLGGRIRAARQNLHLSLAQVAGERYSTSLISQIERNRVEPSEESLKFLAHRLNLPLEDLEVLARQPRDSESEVHKYRTFEDQRISASQLLESNQPTRALEKLKAVSFAQLPAFLRWRFFALRAECYFKLRRFLPAQRDFLSAVALLPEVFPSEQHLEAITLRLHLAAATRELGQLGAAYVQFKDALAMMNDATSLRYVAEAHWGLALVLFEQTNDIAHEADRSDENALQIQDALKHAEDACTLYLSIGETLRASLLNCQIGLIEQSIGKLDDARKRLRKVFAEWQPTLTAGMDNPLVLRYTPKERANAVSAAACYLAIVELEAHQCDLALEYVQQAIEAGNKSYIIRRAEAQMTYGRILESRDVNDPKATEAFQNAVKVLSQTDRIAAKINAHDLLGRHLLKVGDTEKGEMELNEVRRLSHTLLSFTNATTDNEDELS